MLDAGARERVADLEEVIAAAGGEGHGDGVGRDALAHALARGVDGLRDLRPVGEIGADDDVVDVAGGLVLVAGLGGPDVNGC